MTGVRTPHENSEYPYEPEPDLDFAVCWKKSISAWELSLCPWEQRISTWGCTSAQPILDVAVSWNKKAPQRESCHYAHENSEYPYESAHPHSLIWILLFVLKKALQRESCHYSPWEQRISIWACASAQPILDVAVSWKKKKKTTAAWQLSHRPMRTANTHISLRIRAAYSRFCCLLEEKAPQRESCHHDPWEQQIPIWACASAQPDLDFAVCWKKKHRSVRAVTMTHENSKYPYEPAHPRSLFWTLLSVGKKSTPASPRPMRTAHTHMSLHIPAAWSGLCCLLEGICLIKKTLKMIRFSGVGIHFEVFNFFKN